MVGQALNRFGQTISMESFEGVDDAGMERAPPLQQEAVVGHLVGEGVLEGVLALRGEARLIEELSRLQVRQPVLDDTLRHLSDDL